MADPVVLGSVFVHRSTRLLSVQEVILRGDDQVSDLI